MGSVNGNPPNLASLVIDYGSGTVNVSDVEAGDDVYVYAYSTHKGAGAVLVGQRTGPGQVSLDLSGFLSTYVSATYQAPVNIDAVWTTDGVNFSARSNVLSTGITAEVDPLFSAVSIDENGALNVTVSGLNDNDVWIVRTVLSLGEVAGHVAVGAFKGNGAKVATLSIPYIYSLEADQAYTFNVVYYLANGYYADLLVKAFAYTPAAPSAPTLGSVANDETGTSVTVTLTPPAAGNYTQCRIYYRTEDATSWTSGGTYTGAQGVAGTKQITGLSANTMYSFYAVAEYGDFTSSPTQDVRCFVHAGDYYRAALAALKSELVNDATLSGYVDSINVQEWDVDRLPSVTNAGIVISPAGRLIKGIALRLKQDAAEIHIHCLTDAWNDEDGLDGSQGLIDLANDVFNVINGNDCGGTVVPVTGLEAAGQVPFTKLPGGHYYHTVVKLGAWLPAYTD